MDATCTYFTIFTLISISVSVTTIGNLLKILMEKTAISVLYSEKETFWQDKKPYKFFDISIIIYIAFITSPNEISRVMFSPLFFCLFVNMLPTTRD